MIPLDHSSCSIRLSDVLIVIRAFLPSGLTRFRIWNQFTTDWDTRSLYLRIPAVSIADHHTLLTRFPTAATLSAWAENISLAYGSSPLCKRRERAQWNRTRDFHPG